MTLSPHPAPLPGGKTGAAQLQQRARACRVAGCDAVLAPGYYTKYRICALHSSTQAFIIGGISSRWCQQASRGVACKGGMWVLAVRWGQRDRTISGRRLILHPALPRP